MENKSIKEAYAQLKEHEYIKHIWEELANWKPIIPQNFPKELKLDIAKLFIRTIVEKAKYEYEKGLIGEKLYKAHEDLEALSVITDFDDMKEATNHYIFASNPATREAHAVWRSIHNFIVEL